MLLVSVAAGGFGSLVGIGGGLIIVPVLTIALGVELKDAIAASLIGVIATSLSASPRYIKSGIVDRRLALLLLVAATLGGLTGGLTSGILDGRVLALLFALLLGGVAIEMLRQVRNPADTSLLATPGGRGEASTARRSLGRIELSSCCR